MGDHSRGESGPTSLDGKPAETRPPGLSFVATRDIGASGKRMNAPAVRAMGRPPRAGRREEPGVDGSGPGGRRTRGRRVRRSDLRGAMPSGRIVGEGWVEPRHVAATREGGVKSGDLAPDFLGDRLGRSSRVGEDDSRGARNGPGSSRRVRRSAASRSSRARFGARVRAGQAWIRVRRGPGPSPECPPSARPSRSPPPSQAGSSHASATTRSPGGPSAGRPPSRRRRPPPAR